MTLPHGRGKESFRVFTKTLNDEKKHIISAIEEGEGYTQSDVFRFLDTVVNEYIVELKAQELQVDIWSDRAVDSAIKAFEFITGKYDLEKGGTFEDNEEQDEENEPDPPEEPEDIENGTLFGHPIMTPDNKATIRSKGKPRKRIMDTLEDLKNYVIKVPYILAIQILNRSDGTKAYRVWVEASKDKKKRKS